MFHSFFKISALAIVSSKWPTPNQTLNIDLMATMILYGSVHTATRQ